MSTDTTRPAISQRQTARSTLDVEIVPSAGGYMIRLGSHVVPRTFSRADVARIRDFVGYALMDADTREHGDE
jgi:hypothetical protein